MSSVQSLQQQLKEEKIKSHNLGSELKGIKRRKLSLKLVRFIDKNNIVTLFYVYKNIFFHYCSKVKKHKEANFLLQFKYFTNKSYNTMVNLVQTSLVNNNKYTTQDN